MPYERLQWGSELGTGMSPIQNRTSEKNIKISQGKLPKIFFEMMDNLELADIWRIKNGGVNEFTYFSERHISFSRINITLLATGVYKVDILPKTFSDHNPVIMTSKRKNGFFRLRLKGTLLQQQQQRLNDYLRKI